MRPTPTTLAMLLALTLPAIASTARADEQPPAPRREYQPKPEEAWLLERLAELATIRPGVTIRDEVETVLQSQRGISTREHHRYAMTVCRYIHVTVTYKPNPTDDESRDVVESISEPTLVDH